MSAKKETADRSDHFRLRGCILKMLYGMFREHPYAQAEPGQIMELCRTDVKELNWNLVYLEKCGYLELGRSFESPPFIACSVALTAQGIDLVENEDEYGLRFPC
ncbi:MAG: hypothetical protein P1P89_05135 [Desulfobacterales bacterium]|nr:hypothetical protein [Desulfobacterales bacterium]